jgi:signal transduction histidine kinase
MPLKPARLLICLLFISGFCRAQSTGLEKVQQSILKIHDSLAYVDALNRVAMLSYEKNIDSTFYYAKQAREIANRLQYAQGKADALNNLGIVYDIKGDIQLALRYYNEAYNSYTAIHDSSNIVQALMNIGELYQEIGKDEKAIAYYRNAMNLGRNLTKDSIMSLVIFNFLVKYPAEFPKDSVGWYFNKAHEIAQRYNDYRLLLALDQINADNAFAANKTQQGIALLKKAIDKAITNHLYFLSLDMIIDAADHLAASDSAKAVEYYKLGSYLTYQQGYLVYSQILTRKLYDFYTVHKDSAAAFYYSRQLVKISDEQDKLASNSGIDYLDYALKDQQLESFRLQSKYQSDFLILAAVICILAVVIAIILWRNWKKTQRIANVLRLQFEQSEATTGALDTMNKNYAKLLKIVAHDLRNPIGAIGTISSMLAKNTLGPAENKSIQMIQTSAQTSLSLINELLETDFEQQQHLVKEVLYLDELLQQCVELLSFKAKDKKQHLLFESDQRIRMEVDKEKVNRVINNLIVNAIKFSPEDSDIFVTAKARQNDVLISIKDAGIGIPIAMQDKVFDPFTTAKRKGTGGEQPFGLGLYISKQIIEAHHGKIGFKSEPGKGTEFFVELPFAVLGS